MFRHRLSHVMGQFSLVDHSGNQPIIYNIVPTRKLIASSSIECGMCVKDTLSSQNKAITPVISTNPSLNEQAGWARRHIQFFGGPKQQHCSGISHCDREDKPPVEITSSCSKFLNFSLGDAMPESSAGWRTEVPIAALPAERGPSARWGVVRTSPLLCTCFLSYGFMWNSTTMFHICRNALLGLTSTR